MARRRTRRGRRRGGGEVLSHDFVGWTTAANKHVTADDLGLFFSRPARVVSARVSWTSTATTSTYMVPSNIPTVCFAILSAGGDVTDFSSPKLAPFGATTTSYQRATNRVEMGQWAHNGAVLQLQHSALANGTTISFCGTVWIHYAPHRIPFGVKATLTDDRLDREDDYVVVPAAPHDPTRQHNQAII